MFGQLNFLFVPVEFQFLHGVAFALNPIFHPDGPTETRTVRGTKLVVLSAGSFGTPGILERSGIGARSVLEGAGVEQRVDLPGVGENYQGPSNNLLSLQKKVSTTWHAVSSLPHLTWSR
jgi:choline dehydrogenase-like flavoprotein